MGGTKQIVLYVITQILLTLSNIVNSHLFLYRCALYLLRCLVAIVVILMYIGSGVAIYFTVDWVTDCPSVESKNDVNEG